MMIKLNRLIIIILAMLFLAGCGSDAEEGNDADAVSVVQEEEKSEAAEEGEENAEFTEPAERKGSFEVHYLDVGQADATLIMCDGKNMLIDGGNVEDSSLIYAYLKEHGVDTLDYMICTHAHEDHIGGLSGALNYAQVDIAYCPVEEYDTKAFADFKKYLKKQGKEITVPEAGTEFRLGNAKCKILGLNIGRNDDPNNTSIVLKVQYGDTAFLFSGDAEQSVEKSIIEDGYNISCTVMKIPHHGSDTSLSYRWLNDAMPEYGVLSVGKKNSYGHPCEDTLSKLRDAEVKVFRTDMQGHIICTSDGKEVSFKVERNENADTLSGAGAGSMNQKKENQDTGKNVSNGKYIINTNTGKFHYPGCRSVDDMKEKNKKETQSSRDELVADGYSPCGNCKP